MVDGVALVFEIVPAPRVTLRVMVLLLFATSISGVVAAGFRIIERVHSAHSRSPSVMVMSYGVILYSTSAPTSNA